MKYLLRGGKNTIDERDYIIVGAVSRFINLLKTIIHSTKTGNYISAYTLSRSLFDTLLVSTYLLKHKKWRERSKLFYKFGRLYKIEKKKLEEIKDAHLLEFAINHIKTIPKVIIEKFYEHGSSFVHFSQSHLSAMGKEITTDNSTGKRNFKIDDAFESIHISLEEWEEYIGLIKMISISFIEALNDPLDV
jgi:hypothetical protein